MKLKPWKNRILFNCPGCGCVHYINDSWKISGSPETPTVSPSILVNPMNAPGTPRCHLFIRHGQIQYLSDCDHDLAGKTVPLPDFT